MNLKNTTGSEDRLFEKAGELLDDGSRNFSSDDLRAALERLDSKISELGEEKTGLQQENSDLAERIKVLEARIDELEASVA